MPTRKSLADYETNVSFAAFLGVAFLMLGLVVIDARPTDTSTANILQAVSPRVSIEPGDDILLEPRTVEWGGYIRRVFVGGEGLELAGSDAPGGIFQAYSTGRLPILEGQVLIRGIWRGYTCAYGGNNGWCVPEVDIESIAPLPKDY